ncbi:MAG: galactokinase [Chitinophagaceae bacterium]|nr:galactokinase [Chitinophagaceae bacterium]
MQLADKVSAIYQETFGCKPQVFASPGRINFIGEHTDYNNGWVLPAAIDKAVYLAIGIAEGTNGKWISVDFKDTVEVDFSNITKHKKQWVNYLLGMVQQFKLRGHSIPAFNVVLASDIPIGAGLSSSAALECVTGFAINEIHQLGYTLKDIALIAQQAENQFIGLQCGIMDMFASLHGKEGFVMRLDCKTLDFEYFPIPLNDYKIVLIDTGVKHSLASSEYNVRRLQCEEGVSVLKYFYPEITSLRDVTIEMIELHKEKLAPIVLKRCKFVLQENNRVHEVCKLLDKGLLHEAGAILYQSHEGLKNDYEVSCPELDLLVDLVKDNPYCMGARMMGGGFGGCTINIIHKDHIATLMETIDPIYSAATGKKIQMYEAITGKGSYEILTDLHS